MRKRTIQKNFWLSYEEVEKLKGLSSKMKITEADTIRKLLNEAKLTEAPPKEFYDAINKIYKASLELKKVVNHFSSLENINESLFSKYLKNIEILRKDIYDKYI